VELVKDALAFVSPDAAADQAEARRGARSAHRRDFVLPDGVHNLRGFVRQPLTREQEAAAREAARAAAAAGGAPRSLPQEQVLALNNERFMVPEALFRPADIGLRQAGAPELVAQAVAGLHPGLQPLMWANVVLTGGALLRPAGGAPLSLLSPPPAREGAGGVSRRRAPRSRLCSPLVFLDPPLPPTAAAAAAVPHPRCPPRPRRLRRVPRFPGALRGGAAATGAGRHCAVGRDAGRPGAVRLGGRLRLRRLPRVPRPGGDQGAVRGAGGRGAAVLRRPAAIAVAVAVGDRRRRPSALRASSGWAPSLATRRRSQRAPLLPL